MQEGVGFKGHWHFKLIKPNGQVVEFEKDNIVVNAGYDLICDALAKSTGRPGVVSHLAVGAGATAADPAQTALVTESARKAVTYLHSNGTKTFTLTAQFDAGEGTGTLTEAGAFNSVSGGTMLNRLTFTATPKAAPDVLIVTFTMTLN